MNTKERAERLLLGYSPFRSRKAPLYGLGIFGLDKKNKDQTILGRALDSYRELRTDLGFLAGMLTVLPLLDSPRKIQHQAEGERILKEGDELIHRFLGNKTATVNLVRKMRICGERIIKLRDKVQKEMSRT